MLAASAYVVDAVGAQLSALIAIATIITFAGFGWHVASGGAFEMRTLGAMILRSGVWIAIQFRHALGWVAWDRREEADLGSGTTP